SRKVLPARVSSASNLYVNVCPAGSAGDANSSSVARRGITRPFTLICTSRSALTTTVAWVGATAAWPGAATGAGWTNGVGGTADAGWTTTGTGTTTTSWWQPAKWQLRQPQWQPMQLHRHPQPRQEQWQLMQPHMQPQWQPDQQPQ